MSQISLGLRLIGSALLILLMSLISSVWENLVTFTHFSTEDSHLPDASQCASPLSPSLVPQSPSPPHLGPTSNLAPPGVTGQPEDSDLAPPGVTGQTEDSYTFLRSLNAIAIHSLDNDNSDKSYLCWECGVRDQFYFAKA